MGRPCQMCLGGISGGEPYADGAARRPPIHEFGFRPQVDGRRPSGLLVRDLAPAGGDPRTVLRDRAWLEAPSGRHGEPPSSEHSPTRSVSSVCAFGPDGWGPERRRRTLLAQAVDPDGVGRARLGCSVRSPSGIRRRCRRAVGPRVGTRGTVGCSALPASPEAGFAPRRRSKLAVAGCQVRACREDRLGKAPPLFRAGALAGSGGVSQRPASRGVARGVP